eukprot:tig00020629_g12497.t1
MNFSAQASAIPFIQIFLRPWMKILGVDVGVINFAWCLIEFDPQTKESQILDWQKIALFPSARCCGRLVARLVEVTRGHSAFGLPDQIAIEGQRTGINRCIECTLHALLYGRARIVSPRAIKHFFKISNPSYKERKRAPWTSAATSYPPSSPTSRIETASSTTSATPT